MSNQRKSNLSRLANPVFPTAGKRQSEMEYNDEASIQLSARRKTSLPNESLFPPIANTKK